jgi:flagellar protein FliO/FliZ
MDFGTYFRFLIALVFVLALIGLIAWIARRFGFGHVAVRPRGAARRIEIVETAAVDAKRRLVLLRRDRTEHLVLLGTNSELLIESGISPPASQGAPATSWAPDSGADA